MTSRFILGSGKFSLDLVKACIEKAGTQIITLALRRANQGGLANILDYIPKNITLLPNTSGARNAEEAVQYRDDFPESLDVVILSRLKLSMIPNIFFRTTMKRSRQQRFLQKKGL